MKNQNYFQITLNASAAWIKRKKGLLLWLIVATTCTPLKGSPKRSQISHGDVVPKLQQDVKAELPLLMITSFDLTILIIILHPKRIRMNMFYQSYPNKLISDYVERVSHMSRTQTGAPALVDSRGYMYTMHRIAKVSKKTSWQCRSKNSGCKARCQTLNGVILSFYSDHIHPPPLSD